MPFECRFRFLFHSGSSSTRCRSARSVRHAACAWVDTGNNCLFRESAREVSRENPAISGVIVLHDLATGRPRALLESSYLTALRTALTGALAVDILALPEATRVAIIGARAQGRSQLQALRMVRPIKSVCVLDPSPTAQSLFIADPCW